MTGTQVYVNTGPLLSVLSSIREGLISESLLMKMGMFVRFQIDKRTAAGKDVEGSEFVPYSPRYRLFREKTGHPTEKVNLFYTGAMLSAMTVEPLPPDAVRIYFLNTMDRKGVSNAAKAFYLDQDRHFFGMSEEDIQQLEAMLDRHLSGLMGK